MSFDLQLCNVNMYACNFSCMPSDLALSVTSASLHLRNHGKASMCAHQSMMVMIYTMYTST